MSEETFQNMVAPYNPDDAEAWIPQTPAPDTMPPFNPELEAPSPVDTSRIAEQHDDDRLCYKSALLAYSDQLQVHNMICHPVYVFVILAKLKNT
eukprot:11199614-Lingulodinium_polyedra.AAC.1